MNCRRVTLALAMVAAVAIPLSVRAPAADEVIDVVVADAQALRLAQAGPESHPDRPGPDHVERMMGRLRSPTSQPDEEGRHRSHRSGFQLRVRQSLTEEQTQEVLAYLKEHRPQLVVALEQIRRKDQSEYEKQLRRVARPTIYMIWLKKTKPDLHGLILQDLRLTEEIHQLARKSVDADDPTVRSEVNRALRDRLDRQFEVNMDRRRLHIAELKKQIGLLESQIQVRQANKEQFIEQRLQDVLDRARKARQQRAEGDPSIPGHRQPTTAASESPTTQPDQ